MCCIACSATFTSEIQHVPIGQVQKHIMCVCGEFGGFVKKAPFRHVPGSFKWQMGLKIRCTCNN